MTEESISTMNILHNEAEKVFTSTGKTPRQLADEITRLEKMISNLQKTNENNCNIADRSRSVSFICLDQYQKLDAQNKELLAALKLIEGGHTAPGALKGVVSPFEIRGKMIEFAQQCAHEAIAKAEQVV